jgi:hypothetical protein
MRALIRHAPRFVLVTWVLLTQVLFFDPRRIARFAYAYGFRLRRVLEQFEADQQIVDNLSAYATDIERGVDIVRRRLLLFAIIIGIGAVGLFLDLNPAVASRLGPLGNLGPDTPWLGPISIGLIVIGGVGLLLQSQELRRPARRAATIRGFTARERGPTRPRVRVAP